MTKITTKKTTNKKSTTAKKTGTTKGANSRSKKITTKSKIGDKAKDKVNKKSVKSTRPKSKASNKKNSLAKLPLDKNSTDLVLHKSVQQKESDGQTSTSKSNTPPLWQKHYLLLATIVIGIIIVGLTFLSISAVNNRTHMIADAFNKNNIVLEPTTDLKANFIQSNETSNYTFEFEVKNNSEYTFEITAKVESRTMEATESGVDSKLLSLYPQEEKKFMVNVPLQFGSDGGEQITDRTKLQDLIVTLHSEIQPNRFVESDEAQITYNFQIKSYLYSATELVDLNISPNGNNISYSAESPPAINFTASLVNLTGERITPGFYEVNLLNTDKEIVQPLMVNKLSLDAEEVAQMQLSSPLNLPPANLIIPGEKDYLLQFIYKGMIGSRKFEVNKITEQPIRIRVVNI